MFVVGTAHFSEQSADDVARVIEVTSVHASTFALAKPISCKQGMKITHFLKDWPWMSLSCAPPRSTTGAAEDSCRGLSLECLTGFSTCSSCGSWASSIAVATRISRRSATGGLETLQLPGIVQAIFCRNPSSCRDPSHPAATSEEVLIAATSAALPAGALDKSFFTLSFTAG